MAPSSEQTILGVLITHPDWLKKCDIPKDFFKTDYQQLIFREILAGTKDAGNIVQRIEIYSKKFEQGAQEYVKQTIRKAKQDGTW